MADRYTKAQRRAYNKAYKAAHRERAAALWQTYYVRNGDRLRAKATSPEGKRRQASKNRKHNSARRARKLAQFIEHVEASVVYQMHGGMCGICKGFVPEADFHIDHITPLSKGGMHGYVNVQPAHPACNLKKHNKE